jgi:ribosomal protein S27AE
VKWRAQRVPDAQAAAATAAFLEGQEITRTQCVQCSSEIAGVNGRYACGNCGWVNPWTEGHKPLPTADDDVQEQESPHG